MSIPAATAGHDVDYIVGGARKTLLTLVNYGCIAMHVMNSRIDRLTLPDWLAFDLDPSDGFEPAARTALLLRKRLEAHGLEPFVKTSGGRGLHVFVPLRRGAGQDQVRAYAAGNRGGARGRTPDARHGRSEESEAAGARVSRRHAQRVGPDDRAAVLGEVAAARAGVDAARMGRGEPAPGSCDLQHQDGRTADGRKVALVEVLQPSSNAAARLRQSTVGARRQSQSASRFLSLAYSWPE